jgi:predicted transcriptional regulator
MKTIRQIADEIGVTPQAVRDKIKKLNLQSSLQRKNKSFAIDTTSEAAIKQAFQENTANTFAKTLQSENTHTDRLIDMLQAELNIKNRQRDELNARLAEAHSIINSEQLLHGGTIQKQLVDSNDESQTDAPNLDNITVVKHEEKPPKRRLFGFFSRKS